MAKVIKHEHMKFFKDNKIEFDYSYCIPAGDGKVGQQLDALNNALNDLLNKLSIVALNTGKASDACENSEAKIIYAEQALERTERAYQIAKDYIDKEGRAALSQALQALEDFGQGSKQMTEIARRASALAAK